MKADQARSKYYKLHAVNWQSPANWRHLGRWQPENCPWAKSTVAAIYALTDNARIMLKKRVTSAGWTESETYYFSDWTDDTAYIELKAFASRHRVPKGSADVIKVMYSAVARNHSMEKNNVERRIKAPSMPLFVNCDELGLEQIFDELVYLRFYGGPS